MRTLETNPPSTEPDPGKQLLSLSKLTALTPIIFSSADLEELKQSMSTSKPTAFTPTSADLELVKQSMSTTVRFDTEEAMFREMDSIRRSNSNEASGTVIRGEDSLQLCYSISNSSTMTKLSDKSASSSWHSHPDSEICDMPFDSSILKFLPPDIGAQMQELFATSARIDQASAYKISAGDILAFACARHHEDFISLPPHHILHLSTGKAPDDSPFTRLGNRLREITNDAVRNAVARYGIKDRQFIQTLVMLEFWARGCGLLEHELCKLGVTQISAENFPVVLEKLGVPFRFFSIR